MAICNQRSPSSLLKSAHKRCRRRPSTDTTPLDDSISSVVKSEESLLCSILRHHSTGEVSTAPSVSSDGPRRSVTFGEIEIHSHQCILGDNPSVSSGPPVTLEWTAFETHKIDVDVYEERKPAAREKESMILPRSVREEILRREGFSRGEIREATEVAQKLQLQRRKSSNDGRLMRHFEKWLRLLKRGKHSIDGLEIHDE